MIDENTDLRRLSSEELEKLIVQITRNGEPCSDSVRGKQLSQINEILEARKEFSH